MAGLEQVLAEELAQLGAENINVLHRAVSFEGDKELMYRANYCLRTALRILKPVSSFVARDEQMLYDKIFSVKWHEIFDISDTFAVDAVVSGKYITHSQYAALKVKDAVADEFRSRLGARPSVDVENPNFRINIHIENDKVTLSYDSSGESLHKRGYRKAVDKAPVNEVLAAGLVKLTGWKYDCNFIDCMCGSGTIPIEAAMQALAIPAGYFRKNFGFQYWSDFDKKLWEKVQCEENDKIRDFDYCIYASDHSSKAVSIARSNIQNAHLSHDIILSKCDMQDVMPPESPGIMIINPPYGERLEEDDIVSLYRMIGDTLKKNFAGYQAWIISSDNRLLKLVGLKPSKKIEVYNGPLECRFVKFEVFKGTYKDMKSSQ